MKMPYATKHVTRTLHVSTVKRSEIVFAVSTFSISFSCRVSDNPWICPSKWRSDCHWILSSHQSCKSSKVEASKIRDIQAILRPWGCWCSNVSLLTSHAKRKCQLQIKCAFNCSMVCPASHHQKRLPEAGLSLTSWELTVREEGRGHVLQSKSECEHVHMNPPEAFAATNWATRNRWCWSWTFLLSTHPNYNAWLLFNQNLWLWIFNQNFMALVFEVVQFPKLLVGKWSAERNRPRLVRVVQLHTSTKEELHLFTVGGPPPGGNKKTGKVYPGQSRVNWKSGDLCFAQAWIRLARTWRSWVTENPESRESPKSNFRDLFGVTWQTTPPNWMKFIASSYFWICFNTVYSLPGVLEALPTSSRPETWPSMSLSRTRHFELSSLLGGAWLIRASLRFFGRLQPIPKSQLICMFYVDHTSVVAGMLSSSGSCGSDFSRNCQGFNYSTPSSYHNPGLSTHSTLLSLTYSFNWPPHPRSSLYCMCSRVLGQHQQPVSESSSDWQKTRGNNRNKDKQVRSHVTNGFDMNLWQFEMSLLSNVPAACWLKLKELFGTWIRRWSSFVAWSWILWILSQKLKVW